MLQRYDALDAENSSLRQQLAAATVRASELSLSNEQLLKSLDRHKGALGVVSWTESVSRAVTLRVLGTPLLCAAPTAGYKYWCCPPHYPSNGWPQDSCL